MFSDSSNSGNEYSELISKIQYALENNEPVSIKGGGSKFFYGHECYSTAIETKNISGIISYEPSELVVTVRAGTLLSELEKLLYDESQMLAFEPPHYDENTTIGGVVASGLSGPRRPYSGAVRDFVLGIRCLTGNGKILTFGGQVMKNVAGYDVSRLMTGAMGTLGILLEISLKLLPRSVHEITLLSKMNFDSAIDKMNELAALPIPLTAAVYDSGNLYIRLSGKESAVNAAQKIIGMEYSHADINYWNNLRDHKLDFFSDCNSKLWRISVPQDTKKLKLDGKWLIDWGGAQRWYMSNEPIEQVRNIVSRAGGHATIFRRQDNDDEIFHPLPHPLHALHQKIKHAFDPKDIFNPGKMYKEI